MCGMSIRTESRLDGSRSPFRVCAFQSLRHGFVKSMNRQSPSPCVCPGCLDVGLLEKVDVMTPDDADACMYVMTL